MYKVVLTKQAQKDQARLKSAGLSEKAKELVDILEINPYQNPPPFEKLVGNLAGFKHRKKLRSSFNTPLQRGEGYLFASLYSRRINIQHRLIYYIDNKFKLVKILRMWTHYG